MSDDDDLPWCLEVLQGGPIILDENTSQEELTGALEERLDALLECYFCEATAEGWKDLALKLALEHCSGGVRAMEVRTPVDRNPVGRPLKRKVEMWFYYMERHLRRDPTLTVKAAAEIVKRERKDAPSVRRLQNIYSGLSEDRRALTPRAPWEQKIHEALHLAASRLEGKSR